MLYTANAIEQLPCSAASEIQNHSNLTALIEECRKCMCTLHTDQEWQKPKLCIML